MSGHSERRTRKEVQTMAQNKTTNLIIRISEREKDAIRKVAEDKSMSMSELVLWLIRAEIEKAEKEKA